jgi:leucine dehydrogenase
MEMDVTRLPAFDDHEIVRHIQDDESGLEAIIAVHSTVMGPAIGGCRFWHYASAEDAATDALRLSRAMTLKNAMADIPFGGGKSVIMARGPKTPALLQAFGRALDALGGRYITAEDVGIGVADLREVRKASRYVAGIPHGGRHGGNPAPYTAYGVFLGLKAAVAHRLGTGGLAGLRIGVQGLGSVGYRLCRHLHEAGARLVVSDVDEEAVRRAAREFGARAVVPDAILGADVDVLAPCALGGCLDDATIPRIRAKVVAGAANNQLLESRHGGALHARGILYAPDYVINAGGVISVAHEYQGDSDDREVWEHVGIIADNLHEIFAESARSGRPTNAIADEVALARLATRRRRRGSSLADCPTRLKSALAARS